MMKTNMTISPTIRANGTERVTFRPALNNNAVTKKVFKSLQQAIKYVRWCQRSEPVPA